MNSYGFFIGVRIALLATTSVTMLSGCAGYVPGRQTYWDDKLADLCRHGVGVRIFENVHVSKHDIDLLGRSEGMIVIPVKRLASPGTPVYSESRESKMNEWNPEVWRSEVDIFNRDGRLVAQWVSYSRVGGDIPSHAHPSSFTCPDPKKISADLQSLFIVNGDAK